MDVEIRPARADDYAAFTRLFGELAIPDPVPSAERFETTLVPQMRVAVADEVIGYVTWRPYGSLVHVVQLAVDRNMRGRRIGESLLEHVRGEALALGCERWYLNVKRDNTPALRLYERCGFRHELEAVVMKLPWAQVPPATDIRIAEPDEDAAIAARFKIPAERITTLRARGMRMIALRDAAGAVIGFAPFDPGFPGAPSFYADRPELAPALLAAIRAYALPQYDFVRLTVEGDRALADAVLALGAELTFEILRLGAPLSGIVPR